MTLPDPASPLTPAPLDLAIVSDVHERLDWSAGEHPTERLEAALAAHTAGAQLLIDLGDRITEESVAADLKRLERLRRVFEGTGLARHHLLGNHDVALLTPQHNAEALGQPTHSHTAELNGHLLVFWQPNTRFERVQDGLHADQTDLDWLRDTLAATRLPTLVFSHFPLDGASMDGNFYFGGALRKGAGYLNNAAILDILTRAPSVLACVSGHTHWNHHSLHGGVHFLTVQSLSETNAHEAAPQPAGAIARLKLGDRTLHWQVFGQDPSELTLQTR